MMRRMLTTTIACAAVTLLSFAVQAQEVFQQARQRSGWVGRPIIVHYVFDNIQDPIPPALPAVDGLTFTVQPANTSSQFQIINGRRTSSTETTYPVAVVADQPGRFVIPAFDIDAGGRTWRTTPIELSFLPADDASLLQASVRRIADTTWLGDVIPAELEIRVRPFHHQALPGGKLSMADTWRLIDAGTADWGSFARTVEQLRSARSMPSTQTVADGQGGVAWYVYRIPSMQRPDRVGVVDLGDVTVSMDYPQDIGQNRDPFAGLTGRGGLRITRQRPVTARPDASTVQVLSPPLEGRPADWTGAVGDFTLHVQATPTHVDVGQPVTLRMTVTDVGDRPADLDTLASPALHLVKELTDEFKIPEDRPGGIVSGRSKTFTQSIRPVSDAVNVIPPVPFSWFDPDTGTYATALSPPIPLSVAEGRTVRAADLPGGAPAALDPTNLTTVQGGLLANITDAETLLQRPHRPDPGWMLAAIAIGPLCCIGAFALRGAKRRQHADPGRGRAKQARHRATAALRQAGDDPAAIADALRGLIMDRCDLPQGSSSADVARALQVRDASTSRTVLDLLDQLDRLTYAADGDTVSTTMHQTIEHHVRRIVEVTR